MYQGVTLGALSVQQRVEPGRARRHKRHPTIEDDVVIYAGATILGGDTVIGRGAVDRRQLLGHAVGPARGGCHTGWQPRTPRTDALTPASGARDRRLDM